MLNPEICFFASSVYPMLSQTNISLVGGAEMQQILIARELRKKNFAVSFIVRDHGQKQVEVIEGIKIFKTFRYSSPVKVRYYYQKLRLIWNALKQANADIYYLREAGTPVGIMAFYCILKKKKFVYSLSSEMDVDGTYIKRAKFHEAYLYKFGIKNANCVVVQTKKQQELLEKNFNKESIIVKNAYSLPKEKPQKSIPATVLWVGTMKKELKKPELFIKLAKAIPNAKFQMVGGPMRGDPQYYEKIKKSTSKISNLDFIGFVPYQEIDQYFDQVSIFVNTSPKEGFPNTFLQAWAAYTPVISLNVDPDEVICKYKLGFHSKTFEKMIEDVKLLLKDEKLREEMGINGRKYVEREHDINKIVEEYIKVFEAL